MLINTLKRKQNDVILLLYSFTRKGLHLEYGLNSFAVLNESFIFVLVSCPAMLLAVTV